MFKRLFRQEMRPRGNGHPQTDDVPDALPRDPMRDVPRWMRPGADHDSEASDHYAFMEGRHPGQEREGGRRKRAAPGRGAARPSSPDNAGFANFFADAFGDAFDDGSGSASASSMSDPSEYHESAGGGRGRQQRPRKRQKQAPAGGADEGEAEADAMGGEFENDAKEFKMEKGVNYVGKDLDVTRMLNGETLRTSAREKEALRAAAAAEVLDDAEFGEGPDAFYQRCRNMMVGDDDDDAFDCTDHAMADETKKHAACKLCRYAGMRSAEIDAQFQNAFDMMCDVELEKYGYAHFAQICREMRIVFNSQQQAIKSNHGEAFFVTTDEVARHFLNHDISNPLRLIGEQVFILRDVLRKGRKFIFGDADGRNFWNSPKTKVFLATQKQYKDLVFAFSVMRQQLNLQQPWTKMRAPLPPGGNRQKSRHLTGAPVDGRFTNQYVK